MNIIGDVAGKKCIIIDDMIDTAGTITLAAAALLDKGADSVYACCTHAVLSGPAVERLDESDIREVIVTDSIQQPEGRHLDKLQTISVGTLVGEAIKRIHENRSVSPLFQEKFKLEDLSKED